MKSVVQEASSIGKAIELALKAAGEPRQFSVKILEVPQKNFLGFTKSPAKVALLFEEAQPQRAVKRDRRDQDRSADRDRRDRDRSVEREPRERREDGRRQQEPRVEPQSGGTQGVQRKREQEPRTPRESRESPELMRSDVIKGLSQQVPVAPAAPFEQAFSAKREQREPREHGTVREPRPEGQWDAELVTSAQSWLSEILTLMGFADVQFTVEAQNYFLRITLSRGLVDDEVKEKHLLASLSTLMLATLKRQSRKALRGHKVVLVHP